ncbi:MAG: helix-turn-helix domain-containing protein [Carbonactinosporaceae bacterium]
MAGVRTDLNGTSVLGYFAAELRRHRTAVGLTQDQLGEAVSYSGALVGMVETARRAPGRDFAARCDEVLETGGALSRIWPLITRESYPEWFRPFVELEAEATSILTYEVQVVPGLLQTEPYVRAVLRAGPPGDTDEEIERNVAARLERQAVLSREAPPLLWVVLDEAVLRRPVGGSDVMRGQLDHLLDAARSRHVVLQVLPFAAGEHAAMNGAMTLLGFREADDVVYVEDPGSGHVVTRPEQVAACALSYDLLRATALSPAASAGLIAARIGEMSP